MPDEIIRIDYYYVAVPDKPGEGSRILTALRDAEINLLGVSAFPHGARRSKLDLIPEDALAKAAKAAGLKLSKKKSGFLIQGEDRPGAVAEVAEKLAQAAINLNHANFTPPLPFFGSSNAQIFNPDGTPSGGGRPAATVGDEVQDHSVCAEGHFFRG